MDEKDFQRKLHEFVREVNKHVESYVSSTLVFKTILTLRTRSILNLDYEDRSHGTWVFKNEEICTKIHKQLKEVMLMKEELKLKFLLKDEDKK